MVGGGFIQNSQVVHVFLCNSRKIQVRFFQSDLRRYFSDMCGRKKHYLGSHCKPKKSLANETVESWKKPPNESTIHHQDY